MTIGQGVVNFTDDFGTQRPAWQNYSFLPVSGDLRLVYVRDSRGRQGRFQEPVKVSVRGQLFQWHIRSERQRLHRSPELHMVARTLFDEPQELFAKVRFILTFP